ncbi:hypothetical protein ACFOFO_01630 [Undibacterium arcticum]|uniref:Uncharacterized protein n=1 Tax=Undibacterium arcticum TaxID=1762892 RepID=A0ABV7EV72_9BURK
MLNEIPVSMCCASISRQTRFHACISDTVLVQADGALYEGIVEAVGDIALYFRPNRGGDRYSGRID